MRQLLRSLVPRRLRRAFRSAQAWNRHRAWRRFRPIAELPSGLKLAISSPPEWLIFNHIFLQGEYDSSVDAVFGSGDNPLVLDLGASVGYFAARVVDRWLNTRGKDSPIRVIAIEGSPSVFRVLSDCLSANPLLSSRCEAHLGLVGRRSGVGRIREQWHHISNSTIGGDSHGTPVPFLDIEQLLDSNRCVSLLKCDIEGAEEVFLEEYPELLRRTEVVVIEIHGNLCNANRCVQLLEDAGFAERSVLSRWEQQSVELYTRGRAPSEVDESSLGMRAPHSDR
jgi:FkbM family methyltransferase